MDIAAAKRSLATCLRHENNDPSFDDVEVHWMDGNRLVASGYFTKTQGRVFFSFDGGEQILGTFDGDEALELLTCGIQGRITNDILSGAMSIESVVDQLMKDS